MTFLERAMEINTHITDEKILIKGTCPCHFGLEDEFGCTSTGSETCVKCWNREMPNTEPKEDVSFTDDLLNQGYSKGINDAWKLARKIAEIPLASERAKIFGYVADGIAVVDILRDFTPQEAIVKMKAYEEAQKIEVGDVVTTVNGKCPYIVTNVQLPNTLHVINSRNGYTQQIRIDVCKKTGKHIDIQSILEELKGE